MTDLCVLPWLFIASKKKSLGHGGKNLYAFVFHGPTPKDASKTGK